MTSSRRSTFFFALSLCLGCTARGGGPGVGPVVTTDTGSSTDAGVVAPDTVTPEDRPNVSVDVPVTGDDAVTPPPPDVPVTSDDVVIPPPTDVPVGPSCGDGMCGKGETCMSCPSDCGACPARCGDGMCNGGETCTSCPSDCGACPTTCTATSCGACTESTACGWCRTTNSCLARAGSTCADFVTSSSACTVTPPTNITATCTVSTTDARTECGFRHVTTTSCTPGATVTFGCTAGADAGACEFSAGTCVGDPVMRICSGNTTTGCAYASRVVPMNSGAGGVAADDDACGLCPWVRIACPSSGQISVFTRAYNIATPATCTVVFR